MKSHIDPFWDGMPDLAPSVIEQLMSSMATATLASQFADPTEDHNRHTATLIVVPPDHGPLDLHIDNCQKRCVALYESQRTMQFEH